MFSSSKSLNRIDNLQKIALSFLLDDYGSTYEQLLDNAGSGSMSINRLRPLCVEVSKTLNELKPSFMKNILYGKRSR